MTKHPFVSFYDANPFWRDFWSLANKENPKDVSSLSHEHYLFDLVYPDGSTYLGYKTRLYELTRYPTRHSSLPTKTDLPLVSGFNDFKTMYPLLKKIFKSSLDGETDPSMVSAKPTQKIIWKCPAPDTFHPDVEGEIRSILRILKTKGTLCLMCQYSADY